MVVAPVFGLTWCLRKTWGNAFWSSVNKKAYLEAMTASVADSMAIRDLLRPALTDQINDREMFMKGIDYSYYYEEDDDGNVEI